MVLTVSDKILENTYRREQEESKTKRGDNKNKVDEQEGEDEAVERDNEKERGVFSSAVLEDKMNTLIVYTQDAYERELLSRLVFT